MTIALLNLVGDAFLPSSGGEIDVINPSNGELVGRVPSMTPADLSAVFDAAERGARIWRSTKVIDRGAILLRAAALLRAETQALAALITAELGKTRVEATGEVTKAAEFFEYYAGISRLPFGELLPDARPGTFSTVIREPLGIVLLITPWNDPLITPARKLAPALIAGNAVVIKPATEAPLITLKLAELMRRAGLPAGVLGTVTGRGSKIGDALTADPRIRAVSFTGSTAVGLDLQRRVAGRSVRVQTEMGGKNALVVLDDADIDLAVAAIVSGSFTQAGQRCTAASRLILQRGIAPAIRERVAARIASLKVGPGDSAETEVGPVISSQAQADIGERVTQAIQAGAKVIAQAVVSDELGAGAFVAPMLLEVERTNPIWRDEVFGPVLSVLEVESLDEAIQAANDSAYGLSAAVFTRDLEMAFRFIDEIDTGQVSVNQPTSGWDVHLPFGGFKDSGSPFKEQGLEALHFYTRVKTSAVRTH